MKQPGLKYTYFVVYAHEHGLGSLVIKYDKKVNKKTIESFLRDMVKHIEKKYKVQDKVAILNFKEIK